MILAGQVGEGGLGEVGPAREDGAEDQAGVELAGRAQMGDEPRHGGRARTLAGLERDALAGLAAHPVAALGAEPAATRHEVGQGLRHREADRVAHLRRQVGPGAAAPRAGRLRRRGARSCAASGRR